MQNLTNWEEKTPPLKKEDSSKQAEVILERSYNPSDLRIYQAIKALIKYDSTDKKKGF